jgi:hypothetical protein
MKKFDEERMFTEEQKVKDTYHKKGFLKSKQDENDLHMAFSPNKIPKGLTKLQIRRKINKFIKNGRKAENPFFSVVNGVLVPKTIRAEVLVNGRLMMGASIVGKVPNNSRQLRRLLKLMTQAV